MILLNPKYAPLIGKNSRYYIITGGRGSGKSFTVNTILSLFLLKAGYKILFLRKTLTSAYLSIIPEFKEKISLLGFDDMFEITKTEIINKSNGSSILFRGIQTGSLDNTANLKSLQGINILVIDEAEELTDESVFDRIDLSVRQKNVPNKIILIMNPATKEHWIYQRFFEQTGINPGVNTTEGNTSYIHTTYLDNQNHLPEDYLAQIERIKENNPLKYEHQILGGWMSRAEGVIFNNWEVREFKEVAKIVYGQDYGFSIDPTTLIAVSIDKSNKVIYIKECFYRQNLSTSEIYRLNNEYAGDSLIYGDSAEPRLITELRAMGNNIYEATKGQGSITAGITLLQDYKLIIDKGSTNIIKELNNYVWNDKKSGTPIDAFNHGIDAIRYAVYSQQNYREFKIYE